MPVLRIASLAPAGTEVIYLLGADSHLVGVSHNCDYPPAARRLPQLTRTLINDAAPSEQIDTELRQRLRDRLPLYEIDVDRLKALAPTLILAQSQCSVCAVDVEQAAALQIPGASIFSLKAQSVDEMLDECERLATYLQHEGVSIDSGVLAKLRKRCARRQIRQDVRQRVLVLEWLSPLMSAGNWMPELIERAGGESQLATPGSSSPYIEWQKVIEVDPDILVIAPCGFDLARTRVDAHSLRSLPKWNDLRAVKNHRVYMADGNGLFHRCGPRLADSLELLRAILIRDESLIARFDGIVEPWTSA
jgi:iron complex transport system substrate-binding protein